MKEYICISKRSIVLFGIFASFIVPTFLYSISLYVLLTNSVYLLVLGWCVCDFCKNFKKCSSVFYLISLMYLFQGISTMIMAPQLVMGFAKTAIKSMTFCYLIDSGLRRKKSIEFVNVLVWYLLIVITLNFFTLIIFPNGMYSAGAYSANYLMGYDNSHIRWQLPALVLSYIYATIVCGKIDRRTLFLGGVVIASTLLIESGTATIAIGLFVIGVFVVELNIKKGTFKIINALTPVSAVIIGIIGSFIVIDATISNNSFNLLSSIIEYFGKDSTLSGRDVIWINALNWISQNLIWGMGYETEEMVSMRLVGRIGYGSSPHNLFLEILYNGGVCLGIIFILIYIILHKRLMKCKIKKYGVIAGIWLTIISIMGITEPQTGPYLRLTWLIIGNLPVLISEKEMKENEKNKSS